MYHLLLILHSLIRWLALLMIVFAVLRALSGLLGRKAFSPVDNAVRHWTATVTHIQMTVGIILYTQSPLTRIYWQSRSGTARPFDLTFFGIVHISLMLTAVVLLTIGSALAKRRPGDRQKQLTVLLWFSLALVIIVISIPWPFSPFANRPYFRVS